MRDVLISLKPYYYYLIGEGIKKVEVRKSCPKAEDWSRNSWFYMSREEKSFAKIPKEFQEKYRKHFGKVGMRFVCDRVYDLRCLPNEYSGKPAGTYEQFICENSCLSFDDIKTYGKGTSIYGWHITDLVVYDEPRDLSEFAKPAKTAYDDEGYLLCDGCEFANWNIERVCTIDFCPERMITRPPQSWQFCVATEPRQTADTEVNKNEG